MDLKERYDYILKAYKAMLDEQNKTIENEQHKLLKFHRTLLKKVQDKNEVLIFDKEFQKHNKDLLKSIHKTQENLSTLKDERESIQTSIDVLNKLISAQTTHKKGVLLQFENNRTK